VPRKVSEKSRIPSKPFQGNEEEPLMAQKSLNGSKFNGKTSQMNPPKFKKNWNARKELEVIPIPNFTGTLKKGFNQELPPLEDQPEFLE